MAFFKRNEDVRVMPWDRAFFALIATIITFVAMVFIVFSTGSHSWTIDDVDEFTQGRNLLATGQAGSVSVFVATSDWGGYSVFFTEKHPLFPRYIIWPSGIREGETAMSHVRPSSLHRYSINVNKIQESFEINITRLGIAWFALARNAVIIGLLAAHPFLLARRIKDFKNSV